MLKNTQIRLKLATYFLNLITGGMPNFNPQGGGDPGGWYIPEGALPPGYQVQLNGGQIQSAEGYNPMDNGFDQSAEGFNPTNNGIGQSDGGIVQPQNPALMNQMNYDNAQPYDQYAGFGPPSFEDYGNMPPQMIYPGTVFPLWFKALCSISASL